MAGRAIRFLLASSIVVSLILAACGGDDDDGETSGDSDDETTVDDNSSSIADRRAGPDDYVLTSSVTRGEVVVLAEEAEAGLETMEQYLRDQNPESSGDAECWLMERDDGTIEQAMRCGPFVRADGQRSWASYPFSSDEAAQAEGRLELSFESRLVGEIRPFMGSVSLVRPDGEEAPNEAYDDVVEGTGAERPEALEDCTATGTVTDASYGTFDLGEAEFLEVTAVVNDNDDNVSYRHDHTLLSWDDDAGRGVRLWVRTAGIPGEEELESIVIDLDISNRSTMEGGGSGNPTTVRGPDVPEFMDDYDPATGGTVAVDFEIEGRYSYEEPNPGTTDVTITCS